MADLRSFHHVSLSVRDLDASVGWYESVLGFEVLFREEGDERRAAVMSFAGGGYSVGLTEHHGRGATFDPTVMGLDHLAFSVDSADELRAWDRRLRDAGVETSGVIDIAPGAILNFKDADGIALALFWDRG